MDWKLFFKKMAIFSWSMALISILIYIVRYTVADVGFIFSWEYPLIWLIIGGCIFCVLAIFWPKKSK